MDPLTISQRYFDILLSKLCMQCIYSAFAASLACNPFPPSLQYSLFRLLFLRPLLRHPEMAFKTTVALALLVPTLVHGQITTTHYGETLPSRVCTYCSSLTAHSTHHYRGRY